MFEFVALVISLSWIALFVWAVSKFDEWRDERRASREAENSAARKAEQDAAHKTHFNLPSSR